MEPCVKARPGLHTVRNFPDFFVKNQVDAEPSRHSNCPLSSLPPHSRRCDFTQSRNEGAHRHPRRQEQPLPLHGSGGETVQLCKSIKKTSKLNDPHHGSHRLLALKRSTGKSAALRTGFNRFLFNLRTTRTKHAKPPCMVVLIGASLF